MLAQGVGKVPKSLVLGCAGFSSLRLMPNQLGVSKVRGKRHWAEVTPQSTVGPDRSGAPSVAGRGQRVCCDVSLSPGDGPGSVEVVTSPDRQNSCSNPPSDRARAG